MKHLNCLKRLAAASPALAAVALLGACVATPIEPEISGYTCCNLRSHYDWVSSTNVQGGDLIAAGEPARFDKIKKKYYVYGNINGRDVGLRDDTAYKEEDTLRWARRIIVAENPQKQLATWPADVQRAVRYGRVADVAGISVARQYARHLGANMALPDRTGRPRRGSGVRGRWQAGTRSRQAFRTSPDRGRTLIWLKATV
jgi:hypothetical protein